MSAALRVKGVRSPRVVRAALWCTALGVLLISAPAFAAGGSYSGPPILPGGGVPGGFRGVLTAQTVSKFGAVIHGRVDRVFIAIDVPRGAAPGGEEVIVTKAALGLIRQSQYRRVPAGVKNEKAIFALGVLFQKNQHAVQEQGFVRVDLAGKQFHRGEYVVVYSAAARGFVPAPRGQARVVNGHAVVRFKAGTEFAVLAKQ